MRWCFVKCNVCLSTLECRVRHTTCVDGLYIYMHIRRRAPKMFRYELKKYLYKRMLFYEIYIGIKNIPF